MFRFAAPAAGKTPAPKAAPAAANPGQFTVTRSGPTGSPLTVFYAVSGTATNGTDYVTLSGSVVIPIGQSSAFIDVSVVNDNMTEGSETVVVAGRSERDRMTTGKDFKRRVRSLAAQTGQSYSTASVRNS